MKRLKKTIGWGLAAWMMIAGGAQAGWVAAGETPQGSEAASAPAVTAKEVKKILRGKTLYFVDSYGHCVDRGADWATKPAWGVVRINDTVTRLSYRAFNENDQGKVRVRPVRNGLKFFAPDGNSTALLSLHNKRFVYFEDEGYTKLFTAKAAARKYFNTLQRKNRGFSEAMLAGKTFYEVGIDNYEAFEIRFDGDRTMEIISGGDRETVSWRIDGSGALRIDDDDHTRAYLRRVTADYIEMGVTYDAEPFADRTRWFKKEYGRGVGGFNDDALRLAKYLVKNGLMGHKVTRDGKIHGKNFNGYWETDGRVFSCSIPRGDTLEFYTFVLDGTRLMMRQGKNEGIVLRFYFDRDKRDAFMRNLMAGDQGFDVETLRGKTLFANIGDGESKTIIELSLGNDGQGSVRFFNSSTGRFGTEGPWPYTIDESARAIVTTEHDGTKERHRVIEHTSRGFTVREPEGELTYFYYRRLGALEGVVSIDGCDENSGS